LSQSPIRPEGHDFKLSPGQVVQGKYRIERVLAVGGMGAVAAAWHIELEARVAIKVLHDALLVDTQERQAHEQRFIREARALSRVQSEHVVRVFDIGHFEDGTLFMVMEHLEGTDLENILCDRGPLPIAEAVDLVRQACEGRAKAWPTRMRSASCTATSNRRTSF
jgi:serine/threonine-protein kinase